MSNMKQDKSKPSTMSAKVIPKLYCESIEIDCPDHEYTYRSRPASPSPYSRNNSFNRSPSPLTFLVPESTPSNDSKRSSPNDVPNQQPGTIKVSTFLELPDTFRSRSKSLDDGKRTTVSKKPQLPIDCASTYKIYDSILKQGNLWSNLEVHYSLFFFYQELNDNFLRPTRLRCMIFFSISSGKPVKTQNLTNKVKIFVLMNWHTNQKVRLQIDLSIEGVFVSITFVILQIHVNRSQIFNKPCEIRVKLTIYCASD